MASFKQEPSLLSFWFPPDLNKKDLYLWYKPRWQLKYTKLTQTSVRRKLPRPEQKKKWRPSFGNEQKCVEFLQLERTTLTTTYINVQQKAEQQLTTLYMTCQKLDTFSRSLTTFYTCRLKITISGVSVTQDSRLVWFSIFVLQKKRNKQQTNKPTYQWKNLDLQFTTILTTTKTIA